MKSKTTLILAVAVLLLGATVLTASDWVGTFSGDCLGNWKGTLIPTQDPPFRGVWEETSNDPPETGTLRGDEIEELTNSYYVWGDILDDEGNDIGDWEGNFPIPDAQARGIWQLVTGESGRFVGEQVP